MVQERSETVGMQMFSNGLPSFTPLLQEAVALKQSRIRGLTPR